LIIGYLQLINNYQLIYNELLLSNKLVYINHSSIIIINYILTRLIIINYYEVLAKKLSKFDNSIIIINQLTTWWIN